MSLSSISIQRPVLATVFSLLLIIFGVIGFLSLGIREYPEVDPPIVTVTSVYKGANAEIIRAQITEPLEESINGIDGIRTLTSISADQSSAITVEFNLGVDLEAATNDVRDRVSKTLKVLPKDIDPPIVEKLNANANPIIVMTVESDSADILQINDITENVIKERLQTIQGVAACKIFCKKQYAMRLWLDPYKMASKNITASDVQKVLNKENIELPAGRIEGEQVELSIRTLGLMEKAEEFNNMIIKQSDGKIVRLMDIGYAELGAENERTVAKKEFKPVSLIGIVPQQGANSIAIVDEVYKRLEKLKKELPSNYVIDIGFDFTKFEREAVTEVQQTIFITLLLVILIIFIFLRDWRSTLIPVIAIPISIIATFAIMSLTGLSINVLTLLAIVLAIGLVCDDAIVVLENIYSKIDMGLNRKEAALKGMEEIYFAVISTTVTLAAVFLPIMFLPGLTGRLFREFAIVVAGSVLISAFVALTLSPMMCSKVLSKQRHFNLNIIYRITEPFFISLNRGYRYSLRFFINNRWLLFPVMGLILFSIYFFGTRVHSELAPFEDRCNIRITTLAPEGASFEFMNKYMDEMAQYVMDSVPEGRRLSFSMVAPSLTTIDPPNRGNFLIYLPDKKERKRSQKEIYGMVSRDFSKITGIRAFPMQPPTIGDRFGGPPIQFVLLASDFKELQDIIPKFIAEAQKKPALTFVDANLKINKPELKVTIDREKAALLDVSTYDIGQTLALAMSGERYGYFIMNGKQYEVIGQQMRHNRNEPNNLANLYVRNTKGEMIPLDNLVKYEESIAPSSMFSFNRYISATITAVPGGGFTLGDGIIAMEEVAETVLPPTINTALAGQSRDYSESSSSLAFVFLLAIVLIYLILAAQFESFIDPLIILFTVPLALAGAVFTLWYFNMTLNIFSEIGIVMLIGLVTKNGILIVEFANQLKRSGKEKYDAVLGAAVSRLRPILMTSSAMILGVLPIALSLGASAESRQSLGVAVVGGLIFSTFFTLYIIPALYTYMSRKLKVGIPEEEEEE